MSDEPHRRGSGSTDPAPIGVPSTATPPAGAPGIGAPRRVAPAPEGEATLPPPKVPISCLQPGGWPGRLRRALRAAVPQPALRQMRALRGQQPPRIVELPDLDAELRHAAELFDESEEAARAFLRSFEVAPPLQRPDDPCSDAYRAWVWDVYRQVAQRPHYTTANEASPFDLAAAVRSPYPYSTGSSAVVGEELMARGFIVKALGLTPPARIVEFGSGWGNLTLDLVAMGFDVISVEIEDRFCSLMEQRNRRPELLRTVRSDMLSFAVEEPVDAVVFYESFHHCADHLRMLRQLDQMVRRGGTVLFAGEPVGPLAFPWGLRLDGYSLWSTRTYGWLELGFDDAYFAEVLARTGWRAERRSLPKASPLADVIIAHR